MISPKLQSFYDEFDIIKSTADKFEGEDAVDKFSMVLAYNYFSKGKSVSAVQFNQRRTNLNDDQLKVATDRSKKIIEALKDAEQKYTDEIREQTLKKTIVVNGRDIKLIDLSEDDGSINNSSVANYIIRIYNPFRYCGNSYYYSDGIYHLDETAVSKSKVSQIIDEIIEQVYSIDELENKRVKITTEIQHLVMLRNRKETNPFDQYNNMICIKNGILKFDWEDEKVALLPHSPEYVFRLKFNFAYDQNVDTTEVIKWLELLSTDHRTNMISDATYNNLIECSATSIVMQLTRGTFRLSYLVLGEKKSGKTTFTEGFLKNRFFGINACSGTSLKDLCGERFGKDAIIGKAVNICDDITDSLVSYASEWKKLTGGAFIEVEKKYSSKINTLFPMAIFNANDYPKLQNVNEDLAFWNRWKVIEFKNNFDENISYASDNLDKYVSPYLILVIKMVFELYKSKSVKKDDDLNNKLLENWRRDTDSFYSFVFNNIDYDKDGYVVKKYLIELYKEYCDEHSFTTRKYPAMFHDEILKLVPPLGEYKVFQDKILVDFSSMLVYRGIRLKVSEEQNYVKDVVSKKKIIYDKLNTDDIVDKKQRENQKLEV